MSKSANITKTASSSKKSASTNSSKNASAKKTKQSNITARTGPSLALIKYWGKMKRGINIPSCTSVAITLDTLQSTATIEYNTGSAENILYINKEKTQLNYLEPVIFALQKRAKLAKKAIAPFILHAENNFPTAAGLASSSSSVAVCTAALARYYAVDCDSIVLSRLARLGSGSACRSVFGGFTCWRRASEHATQIAPASTWSSLRVLVLIVSEKKKTTSSRKAMLQCAEESAYYSAWVTYNNSLAEDAMKAIQKKDLNSLGMLMRQSYSAMHACMLAMSVPLLYWQAESIEAIRIAERLRKNNIAVWETMDAGPQVKYLTEKKYLPALISEIKARLPQCKYMLCNIGTGLR